MIDVSKIAPHLPPIVWKETKVTVEQSNAMSLVSSWKSQKIDAINQVITYKGDVKAQFGPTILTCDELTIDYINKTGKALGKVSLIDPEGSLLADFLDFSYGEKGISGQAKNVKIKVEGMSIEVMEIDIKPNLWTLYNVQGTPSKKNPPEFEFGAKKLVLIPGKSGRASRPSLDILGVRLGSIPHLTFSLDKRVTGFKLPTVAFKRGQGIGVAWSSAFLLNSNTSFTSKFSALPKGLPSWNFEVASSSINPEKMAGRLSAKTDLMDRYSDSYLDSILVTGPEKEVNALRAPRKLWSIGSYWNLSTKGRIVDLENISKPFDAAYEIGGELGAKGGWMGQARVQTIRGSAKSADEGRFVLSTTLHSGWHPIAPKLSTMARIDSNSFFGNKSQYTTTRFAAGLLLKPDSKFSISGGVATSLNTGSPRFVFDESYHRHFAYARSDVDLGSITLVGLIKYDFDRRKIADVEYGFSLAAGSFEPFFNYRQVPRELQFGARLRMGGFFERLTERNIKRKNTSTTKPK